MKFCVWLIVCMNMGYLFGSQKQNKCADADRADREAVLAISPQLFQALSQNNDYTGKQQQLSVKELQEKRREVLQQRAKRHKERKDKSAKFAKQ